MIMDRTYIREILLATLEINPVVGVDLIRTTDWYKNFSEIEEVLFWVDFCKEAKILGRSGIIAIFAVEIALPYDLTLKIVELLKERKASEPNEKTSDVASRIPVIILPDGGKGTGLPN
jgi:hypothetical protein